MSETNVFLFTDLVKYVIYSLCLYILFVTNINYHIVVTNMKHTNHSTFTYLFHIMCSLLMKFWCVINMKLYVELYI